MPACIERSTTCEAFARVTTVRRASADRIILLGVFADGADGAVIMDPRTPRRIDAFACYRPTISPDGRRIAFERYFSLRTHIALRYRGIVAVYDLGKSSHENLDRGDGRPGRIVNPPAMMGDASERWVDAIAWHSATELRFVIRYDERSHDVTVDVGRRLR